MKMNEVTCDKRKMLIKLQNTKLCLCPGWEGQLVYCYHALYTNTLGRINSSQLSAYAFNGDTKYSFNVCAGKKVQKRVTIFFEE